MTVPPRSEFQTAWENLRYPIKVALREVAETEKKNVHYVGALLVVIAAEGLSLLLGHNRPDEVFVRELIMPHEAKTGVTELMAQDLWLALRHGLAHTYDTKFIEVDDQLVEVVVSWEEIPHLSAGTSPPRIYLNLETMRQDLDRLFERYNREFWSDSGKALPERWKQERVRRAQHGALRDWQSFLKKGGG